MVIYNSQWLSVSPFYLSMHCTVWGAFQTVKCSCVLGRNSTWACGVALSLCWLIHFASTFLNLSFLKSMFTGDIVCSFFFPLWNLCYQGNVSRLKLHLNTSSYPEDCTMCPWEEECGTDIKCYVYLIQNSMFCFLIYPLSEFLSIADSGVLKSTTEVSSNSVSFDLCVCIACYLYKHLLLLHFLADLTFYQQVSTVSCCLFLVKYILFDNQVAIPNILWPLFRRNIVLAHFLLIVTTILKNDF